MKQAPLRKVVDVVNEDVPVGESRVTIRYEVLSCGHRQREKHDIYGPTNAYRRRCRQCFTNELIQCFTNGLILRKAE